MARLLVALLVPVMALVPGIGCTKSCTDMGCGSGVDFYFPELSLDEDRTQNVVEAEGCVGDICESVRLSIERGGAVRASGDGIEINPFGRGLGAALVLPPDADLNIRDTYEVWMELSVNGDDPVRLEDQILLEQVLPNGPGCGPVCLRAEVR